MNGLDTEAMGRIFVWHRDDRTSIEVPTKLLQMVLRERLSPISPLVAVWTQQPADNATLEMRVARTPDEKQITVRPRSIYHIPSAGQSAPAKAYWLSIQFIDNADQKQILVLDAIELERS